jgi:8-oxo-dGTP pyrophosphatase MutT (NUDIX family)
LTDVPQIPWTTPVRVEEATPERVLLVLDPMNAEILPNGTFNLGFFSRGMIEQYMTRDVAMTAQVRAKLQEVGAEDWLEWLRLWIEPHPSRTWRGGKIVTEQPKRKGMPRRVGALGVDDTTNWDPRTYRGSSFRYVHFTGDREGAIIMWYVGAERYSEPEVWIGPFDDFMADQTVDPPDDPEMWTHYNQEFDDGIIWAATLLGAFDHPGMLAEWPLEAVCSDPQVLIRESIDRMLPRLGEYPECLREAVREWLEVNPSRPGMGGATRRGYRAAGLLLLRPEDAKILLLRRGMGMSYPGRWAVPGGTVERHETDEQAALREGEEETGGLPKTSGIQGAYAHADDSRFVFTTFLAEMRPKQQRWKPRLNIENDAYGWFAPDKLPSPLMPGTKKAVRQLLHGDPELGVMATPSYSVCRLVSNDPSKPEYLTTAIHVREDLTGKNVTVVFPIMDGQPMIARVQRCYRGGSFQDVTDDAARAAEDHPVSVLCIEGTDWGAMIDFCVQALPEGSRGASASALGVGIDACFKNL